MIAADDARDRRQPDDDEQALLSWILSHDFPGSAALVAQLEGLTVTPLDEDGSLGLHPGRETRAEVIERIPVEARYLDEDGVVVHLLIHVVDGLLTELEAYREEGGTVIVPPTRATGVVRETWQPLT